MATRFLVWRVHSPARLLRRAHAAIDYTSYDETPKRCNGPQRSVEFRVPRRAKILPLLEGTAHGGACELHGGRGGSERGGLGRELAPRGAPQPALKDHQVELPACQADHPSAWRAVEVARWSRPPLGGAVASVAGPCRIPPAVHVLPRLHWIVRHRPVPRDWVDGLSTTITKSIRLDKMPETLYYY
jgi:hypothetical protein